MAKSRASSLINGKKKPVTLAEKLQRGLSLVKPRLASPREAGSLPNDVKEGHFAVIAAGGSDGPKRFVVPLRFLAHPMFRKLLEMAAEEFGFEGKGALAVPCEPSELEMILADDERRWSETSSSDEESTPSVPMWGPRNHMVQSY